MNNFLSLWMRSVRLWIKLVFTYVRINYKLFFLALVVSVSVVGLAPQLFPKVFPKRPETIGVVGNFTIATIPRSIQSEISFGLTKLLDDDQATSGAAINWQATDSGRVYSFQLDQSLFWHDGTKFDSSQVNYNLRGVQIKKKSLNEVDFVLKDPFAPLPVLLSQPLFKNGLVGLGDFRLDAIRLSNGFITSLSLLHLSDGVKKIYKFYPNENAAAQALKLGTVDKVTGLHKPFNFASDSHYKISTTVQQNVVATLFFNTGQSLFEQKSVRQALAYSLPDQFSQGEPAFSAISKNNWTYNDNVKIYKQDLTLAKKDLEAASVSAQSKITLVATSNLQPVAEQISQIWNSLGLKTQVVTSDTLSPNFDAYLAYLEIPDDPDQYMLWHSTQLGNISGYKSPKIDKLLEEGRETIDPEKRKEIYQNFQRALSEDVPALFLFYPKLYEVSRN